MAGRRVRRSTTAAVIALALVVASAYAADPVAVPDHAVVAQDSAPTTIDVLANDTDPDGGEKLVISAGQPAHGYVTVAADGTSVAYTPASGYCNEPGAEPDDAFLYTVTGGSTAQVTVEVTCDDGGVGPGTPAVSSCFGMKPTIVGTNAGERLRGTRKRDVIAGLGGADRIVALGGNDLVCGGKGNDKLKGGAGADRLNGQAGRDVLIAGKGRDRCKGERRDLRRGCG